MPRWINELMSGKDFVKRDSERLYDIIRASQKTIYVAYLGINPNLAVRYVYFDYVEFILEVYRISCSRMRLSSYRLRNE